MTTKSDNYKFDPKEEKRLQKIIVQSIINSAVEKGEIDPKNKSVSALDEEIIEYLKEFQKHPTEVRLVIDYRNDLLLEAKRFIKLGRNELGCLFYAIWFEHWANSLIVNLGNRNKLQEKEIILIIRELSFHGKLALVPTLFGLPRLNKAYVERILKIAEIRNGFVHYKWQAKSEQLDNQLSEEIEQVIQDIGKVVKYLKTYESRHLYHGKSHKIKKFLKNN
jgi:hypothetical protein